MKIIVTSNILPPITVYDPGAKPSFISKFIKVGAIVENPDGSILYQTEQPVQNPIVKYGVFGLGLAVLTFVIYKIAK